MKAKFLTNRLKSIFLKNSNQSFFEFYRQNPEKIDAILSKLIRFEDGKMYVRGSGWRFDYEAYSRSKGYKMKAEFGFNDGLVYEVEKV